jgi:hypothetical protein
MQNKSESFKRGREDAYYKGSFDPFYCASLPADAACAYKSGYAEGLAYFEEEHRLEDGP